MKLEAIRLIHGRGVPNHYIGNQIYIPSDEKAHQQGSFLILLDQTPAEDGTAIAALTNTLIREYYRQDGTDILADFEAVLLRVNNQISRLAEAQEDGPPSSFSGVIVLVGEREIHLSHIGPAGAWLAREGGLVHLIEDDQGQKRAAFSIITSGEVHAGDVLILITQIEEAEEVKNDLTFALGHTPLFEVGRAFARILREKLWRATEAIFISFDSERPGISQVYLDRSLESLSEKMAHWGTVLTRHGRFVASGVAFFVERARRRRKVSPPPPPAQPSPTPLAPPESSPAPEASEGATVRKSDEAAPYLVKGYWEETVPGQEAEKSEVTKLLQDSPIPQKTIPLPVSFNLSAWRLKPRTIYILIGAIFLLAVAIRAVNTFSSRSTTPPAQKQTAGEREALVSQAESIVREGEKAQLDEDFTTAIAKFLAALDTLKTVTEKNQTEKSKALGSRAKDSLASLTKTSELRTVGDQTMPVAGQMVGAVGTIAFITAQEGGRQAVYKYTGTSLSPVRAWPGTTVAAATSYDNRQKLALLTAEGKVYLLDPGSEEVKELGRSDGQPWPKAHALAAFEKNLYFVSETVTKAVPSGEKFRTLLYNKDLATGAVTSIVLNDRFFYAVESKRQVVRLAANSPKTPLSLSGVPERFLPKAITRIFSSSKPGLLYLLDLEEGRIMEFSTEGGYRRQFLLPREVSFLDCDLTEGASFICLTNKKEVKTLPLPSP